MSSTATPSPVSSPVSSSLVWLVSAASLLLVAGLVLDHREALLRLAIPAAAFVVALVLYFRNPIGYLHFTLWAWFVTPLVRRLVDWRAGFEDHNLVLVTPVIVSAIAGLTLLRERRLAGGARLTPFLLCITGILYGFSVGLVRLGLHTSDSGASLGEIVYALLNWIAPLLFGLHIYLRWRMYDDYKRAIQQSCFWAVLLLGAYGIYQFVLAPRWDMVWLEHMLSDIGAESFGRPEAFQTRVWSTLNSPSVFADVLAAALLLLFFARSRFKPLAFAAGYSAFLLSLVRTSWLGWLVGLVVLARSSKGRQIPRMLFSLLLLPLLVAPLMFNHEIATSVIDRLQTFQSIKKDDSLQIRTEEYPMFLSNIATDPYGQGLSNSDSFHGFTIDSGIIRILFYFGWMGTALFLAGVALCARTMPQGRDSPDPLAPAYRAVLFAMIFELLSNNTFIGPTGALVWTCIALGLSLRQKELEASRLPNDLGSNDPASQTPSALVA